MLTSSLLSGLIARTGQRKAVALFLDELGNFPGIPGLAEKLNTIRSRHLPAWMYFQSIEQIDRRYGTGASAIFTGSADFLMTFRLNDQETRRLVSDLIGTQERVRETRTQAAGPHGVSHNVTRSTERVLVIEPHELGQLKSGEVVTLYRGAAAKGRATPYFQQFPQYQRR